jgi:PTH1 family peptidyl-tRNA hydrolase
MIVGLGNPDTKYRGTRHNIGFEVVDVLSERSSAPLSEKKFKARMAKARLADTDVVLLEPQTYMNLSGESAGPALGFYKLTVDQVIVVHDELDLELGKNRLKKGGGHGGHNGLRSLIQHLPSPEFIRLRMGIGRPPQGWDPADYVLSRFTASDREVADRSIQQAADAIEAVLKDGLARAMNTFNRDPKESPGTRKPKAAEAAPSMTESPAGSPKKD